MNLEFQQSVRDNFTNSIQDIAEHVSEDTLVIIESTVPPGTCKKIIYPLFCDIFKNRKLNINKFYLAHSYERVMPGSDILIPLLIIGVFMRA